MLRIGLTGGIGSGKSTVASTLATLGAVVVDADQVAREVLEPGMPALAFVVGRFGREILAADGTVDRPALGRVVFGDPAALRDLESITHPAIWARTAELVSGAPEDAIVVHDMPLLVEKDMVGEYHLVVVVLAEEETRIRRLVWSRGMPESDARARVAVQADDEARVRAADVLLVNDGSEEELRAVVAALWRDRLVPFERNVRNGIRSLRADPLTLSDHDPRWPQQAARLSARIRHALGGRDVVVEHIGSTAVPGLLSKPVLDLQVGVPTLADADDPGWLEAMAHAGFPRAAGDWWDNAKDGTRWPKRMHGNADPARVAHVHVREVGSPGWEWALMFRDWMRADGSAREEYAALKRDLGGRLASTAEYAVAKEPWFDAVDSRARAWAALTGWRAQA